MKYEKVIGRGKTATVHEFGEGRVIKLFNKGYPRTAIEKEFGNSRLISGMDFEKPSAYGIVSIDDRVGIIYDRVHGESLLDWLLRTGDTGGCAEYMATLHKAIGKNKTSSVPDYKDFLRDNIKGASSIGSMERNKILERIDELSDGDTLCHGDFHPGNIFISKGRATVIDFMNICHGDFLYDVARTVFLVEYTPVPAEVENEALILQMRKKLADSYLLYMNISRELIQDYLAVIIAARAGECPDE